jgi:hypothetical protein
MRPIDRSEILPIGEYEAIRERFRARVIEEKRPRRLRLGDHMSAIFENRDSVMLQIQEMLRTERITSEPGIAHEIETYNDLLPGKDELSLTLFVEIPEKEVREKMLTDLAGLEDHVGVEVDGAQLRAGGKRVGAEAGRTTAVHYLKVPLGAEAAEKLRSRRAASVAVFVDHPRYSARVALGPATLVKLAEDVG